jgi:hypothetical protein
LEYLKRHLSNAVINFLEAFKSEFWNVPRRYREDHSFGIQACSWDVPIIEYSKERNRIELSVKIVYIG